jgi:hypothetical protein
VYYYGVKVNHYESLNRKKGLTMDKNIIELVINNAIETQFYNIEEDNFSDMEENNANECAKNTSKMIELEKIMQSKVTKEAYEIFLEIEDLMAINTSIETQYMFKKGVIEGLTTFEYLKAVRECVYLPMMKL